MRTTKFGRRSASQKQTDTRSALVASAVEVFSAAGYHRASLDEISGRAGYSTGAVYSNFDGKEGLFLACLADRGVHQMQLWEQFFQRADQLRVSDDDLVAVLRAVIPDPRWRRAVVEFYVLPKSPKGQATLVEEQQSWRGVVGRLLLAVARSNNVRLRTTIDEGAEIVAAAIDGLMVAAQANPDLHVENIAVSAIQLVLDVSTHPRTQSKGTAS